MRTDIDNWLPLSVAEIGAIFAEIPVVWCIAGGWALDLYAGKQSRKHEDIDIFLLREEQSIVFRSLSRDWQLYKAEDGKLTPWEEGEFLASTKDIWVSKGEGSPWSFQLMLVDTDRRHWIYGRERSISALLSEIIDRTDGGIPYLKPEIQLLYKGGGSAIREKDHQDFAAVLPMLSPRAREWLGASLRKQFPGGHAWIAYVEKPTPQLPSQNTHARTHSSRRNDVGNNGLEYPTD